jgi:hypothetical protein
MRTNLLTRDNAIALDRRDAIVRPTSWNGTARTIDAVIATSSPVQRQDHQGPFMEILDVAGADLEALRGASVLDSHSQGGVASVIGTVDSARVEGSEICRELAHERPSRGCRDRARYLYGNFAERVCRL